MPSILLKWLGEHRCLYILFHLKIYYFRDSWDFIAGRGLAAQAVPTTEGMKAAERWRRNESKYEKGHRPEARMSQWNAESARLHYETCCDSHLADIYV